MNPISPKQAQQELECNQAVMFDLRDAMDFEFVSFAVDNVLNIPLQKLPDVCARFSKAKRIICADFDGEIALKAAQFLETKGFINIVFLEGGMKNWNRNGLPLNYNVEGGCHHNNCSDCSGCK